MFKIKNQKHPAKRDVNYFIYFVLQKTPKLGVLLWLAIRSFSEGWQAMKESNPRICFWRAAFYH